MNGGLSGSMLCAWHQSADQLDRAAVAVDFVWLDHYLDCAQPADDWAIALSRVARAGYVFRWQLPHAIEPDLDHRQFPGRSRASVGGSTYCLFLIYVERR